MARNELIDRSQWKDLQKKLVIGDIIIEFPNLQIDMFNIMGINVKSFNQFKERKKQFLINRKLYFVFCGGSIS